MTGNRLTPAINGREHRMGTRPLSCSVPVDTSTPAVILTLDPNTVHHGELGALVRSRAELGLGYQADADTLGAGLSRWVDNAEPHQQATELVARLGYQGILDLDYRWDPRDGRYKLLDFNPRLGAQSGARAITRGWSFGWGHGWKRARRTEPGKALT